MSTSDTDAPDTDGASSPLVGLLAIQAHDTRMDQLRHQRDTLPARAQLSDLEAQLRASDAELAVVAEQRDGFAREQRRLEDEVAGVEAKAAQHETTLYGGTVTAPRELQDLQTDIDSLRRRQHDLEDEVLVLMEQIEPLDGQSATLQARRADLLGAREQCERELTAAEAEIDVLLDGEQHARDAAALEVGDAVLADYDRLRARLGGIGVARLEGGRCQGCQLMLSAVERDRIKGLPPEAIVHCEECGRLLVR